MARELSFRVSSNRSSEEVARLLLRYPGFEPAGEGALMGDGAVVLWIRGESETGRNIIHEEFGFEPNVRIVFRLDKFEKWETGTTSAIKACLYLIRTLNADAVLLEDGEEPVLVNRDGKLLLNDSSGFWTPERRKLIAVPYSCMPAPHLT